MKVTNMVCIDFEFHQSKTLLQLDVVTSGPDCMSYDETGKLDDQGTDGKLACSLNVILTLAANVAGPGTETIAL